MKAFASAPVVNRTLTSLGHELELNEHSFGRLEDSSAFRNDPAALIAADHFLARLGLLNGEPTRNSNPLIQ